MSARSRRRAEFRTPPPAPTRSSRRRRARRPRPRPYPSGELHMGHVLNYTLGDVLTHHRRRNGMTVLRPMGFDAFGLPAENAAIKEGIDPRASTDANIEKITAQMRRLGWAIDWPRVL